MRGGADYTEPDDAFVQADTNGDGEVDLDEFLAWQMSVAKAKEAERS